MPPKYDKLDEPKDSWGAVPKIAAGGCCSFCCLIYVVAIAAISYIGKNSFTTINRGWGQPLYSKDGKETTPVNIATYEWWPGCDRGVKTAKDFDKCGGDCFDSKLPLAMEKFNKENKYELIEEIPSRKEDGVADAILTAWWLPSNAKKHGKKTPVVILFHGMSSSFNAIKVQLPAYYLRKLGFSVLVPNLRTHGSSTNSSHGKISWSLEYPFDVLGVWDYVVKDPHGKLGGKRHPSEIGLAGCSMGGFAAASAMGIEEKIVGLWINGSPFDPRADVLGNVLKAVGPVAPLIYNPAWSIIKTTSGLDLDKNLPGRMMMQGPKSGRPIAIVQAPADSACGMAAPEGYKALIDGSDGRYKLKLDWHPEGTCTTADGKSDIHGLEAIKWPEEYQQKLCEFWSPILLKKPCTAKEIVV